MYLQKFVKFEKKFKIKIGICRERNVWWYWKIIEVEISFFIISFFKLNFRDFWCCRVYLKVSFIVEISESMLKFFVAIIFSEHRALTARIHFLILYIFFFNFFRLV